MNIATYNVNGLQNKAKRKKVFTIIREQKLDIVFLQESHCTSEIIHLWQAEWGGNMFGSFGTSEARGVLTLFRRGLPYNIKNICKDIHGRAILLEVKIESITYLLVNIYAPNNDEPQFFATIANMIDKCENRNIIWGGDFNLVMNTEKDRYRSNVNNTRALKTLIETMEEFDLVDIWRHQNPSQNSYTFLRRNPLAMSRLDYILICRGLLPIVERSEIVVTPLTDHSLVSVKIITTKYTRGPGLWKFNMSYLENKNFVKELKVHVKQCITKTEGAEAIQRWEWIKNEIISYCKEKTKEMSMAKTRKCSLLYQKLRHIKKDLDKGHNFDDIYNEFFNAKKELDEHLDNKIKGHVIRSRTQWYHVGEKSSKYFYSLEKNNANKKRMLRICNRHGEIIDDPKLIIQEQFRFYSNLYKSNRDVNFSLKIPETDKKISDAQKMKLEEAITLDELTVAMQQMKDNKTPGCDGLPIEIYKTLWEEIQQPYFEAITESYKQENLMLSARRGVITLIPKKDKNILQLTNWRSLTMLNCDYKILAKALANKFKITLPDFIAVEQTGFMSGRNISTNIRRVIEVIEYTKKRQIPALIMSIDFEKCFDLIEQSSLWKILEMYNFGPNFIRWVRLLFDGFQACINNNGYVSNYFEVTRSVHQGCPISAFLSLACLQVVNSIITNNKNIKGITVYDVEQLLSQFADDTDLFLSYDQKTLDEVINAFDVLYINIGLKINYNKTTLYRIGSLANSDAELYTVKPLHWTNDSISVLGVNISNETVKLAKTNFDPLFDKMEGILSSWSQRALTLTGRVQIVNTLISSLFIYKMQVLPNIPYKMIEKFYQAVSYYLWNGAKPKIKMEFLMLDRKQGGLRLVNLFLRQLSLKTQWIVTIRENEFWSKVAYEQLSPSIGDQVWNCNLNKDDIECVTASDSFWSQVLYAWCMYNFHSPETSNEIKNQIIWFNSHIKINNRVFLWHSALAAGLTMVNQLLSEDVIMSYNQFAQKFPGAMSWYKYTQLINAIPNAWKDKFQEMEFSPIPTNYELLANEFKITNKVYNKLIYNEELILQKKGKWETALALEIQDKDFINSFSYVYQVTIATKYRDFQYRLLHNAIITNRHLFLWKMKNDDLCSFCKGTRETIIHLFVDCVQVARLWTTVKEYVNTYADGNTIANCNWNAENIIFNRVHRQVNNVINLLIVYTKQFIYRQRCLGKNLAPRVWIKEIEDLYRIEYNIAKINNKLDKHTLKWSTIRVDEELNNSSQNDYINQYIQGMID